MPQGNGQILFDLAAVVIPSTLFIEFLVGGRLFLSEIALAVILPLLILQRRRTANNRLIGTIIVLAAIWLLGQVVTDLIRETPSSNYLRGWAKIVFTITNLVALYLLFDGSRRRVLLFGAGLVTGDVLQFLVDPGVYASADAWKWGLGFPSTLSLVLLACIWFRTRLASAALIGSMGAVNLALDFRSLGGICLLTALYIALSVVLRPRSHDTRSGRVRRAVLGLTALGLAGVVVLGVYSLGAQQGLFGQAAQQKYFAQSEGDLGILIGGRQNFLVSLQAIGDSPLIGHGSWAADFKYVDLLVERLQELGYTAAASVAASENQTGLIPTHSYFIGAWVEAGMLGGVFWGFVVLIALKVLTDADVVRERLGALIVFGAIHLVWDALFSPYGAEARLIATYFIAMIVIYRERLAPRLPVGAFGVQRASPR